MIAALFALAAAMIIGGCAAVIQGFPYVRLESGLAMVIAGSVAASSGAVLLGLGVVALGFRRVERAIGRNPMAGPREATAGAAPTMSPDEGRIRLPPVLPAAPAFIVPSVVEPAFDPERPRIEPNLELRADEARAPVAGPSLAELERPVPAEPPPLHVAPPVHVAEPIRAPAPEAPKAEAAIAPDDDLFAAPEPPPESRSEEPHKEPQEGPQEETPALRPSLDTPRARAGSEARHAHRGGALRLGRQHLRDVRGRLDRGGDAAGPLHLRVARRAEGLRGWRRRGRDPRRGLTPASARAQRSDPGPRAVCGRGALLDGPVPRKDGDLSEPAAGTRPHTSGLRLSLRGGIGARIVRAKPPGA